VFLQTSAETDNRNEAENQDRLTDHHECIEERVKVYQKNMENLERTLALETERCEKLDEELSALKTEFSLSKVDVRVLTRSNAELQSSLNEKEKKLADLEEKLKLESERSNELREINAALELKVRELEILVNATNSDMELIQQQLKDTQGSIKQFEIDLQNRNEGMLAICSLTVH